VRGILNPQDSAESFMNGLKSTYSNCSAQIEEDSGTGDPSTADPKVHSFQTKVHCWRWQLPEYLTEGLSWGLHDAFGGHGIFADSFLN